MQINYEYTEKLGKIKWIVLDKTNDSALIISQEIVENRSYHGVGFNDATWEKSDIRKYLNSSFYNAFPDRVKSMINDTNVENLDNSEYGIDGGESTVDKIFLLSIEEANSLFSTNSDRKVYNKKYKYPEAWWLRSPGEYQWEAAVVETGGMVCSEGHSVGSNDGVRPAMWIHFDDSKD